jgi:hypothetical protein
LLSEQCLLEKLGNQYIRARQGFGTINRWRNTQQVVGDAEATDLVGFLGMLSAE